jgi:hypothetical protein
MSKKTVADAATKAADVMPAPDDDAAEVVTTVEAADTSSEHAAEAAERPERVAPTRMGDEGRDEITRMFRELRDAEKKPDAAAAAADADADSDPDARSNDDDAGDGEAAETPARGGVKTVAAAEAAGEGEGDGDGDKPQAVEVTLIIDGKEVKKTLDEVRALAQITVAADNRLEETKSLLRKVEALHAKSGTPTGDATEGEELDPSAATRSDPEHQRAPTIDRAKLREIVERIQVGDADEGAEAIAELVTLQNSGRPTTEQVTPEQIRKVVTESLVAQKTQEDIDSALVEFKSNFTVIAEDPDLRDVALTKLQSELRKDLKATGVSDEDLAPISGNIGALLAAHRHARTAGSATVRTYGKLLSDIGNDMSAKFGIKPAPQPSPGSPHQQQQRPTAPSPAAQRRVEAKRSAPQQPRTAGVRAPQPQAPRPKTSEEQVDEMRRYRGFRVA